MRIPLLLSCLVTINSFAQEAIISIKGKLLDNKSSQPISYASVYIKGSSIGTTTNDDGNFLFHIPSTLQQDTLIISVIGYDHFKSVAGAMAGKENVVQLSQSTTVLSEVVVKASKKELTGKDIVKKAVVSIPSNYPMKPFMIEGFFRDLQKENDKPVELLEAALRFRYKDYNPGYEDVEIIEVRRSYDKRHPVNGTYDRQNSIFDLMEDNYVKHRFGPIDTKGWKFEIDSIFAYNQTTLYKISGIKGPSQSATMFIDSENFAILKLELKMQMVDGEFYRRYLNLPDPHGLQETSFRMIFEFQRIEDKMYLKYQREEDSYNVFNKSTNEVILKQSFIKELFVNKVVKDNVNDTAVQRMNINKSVEGQAISFNPEFWKYYNVPMETAADSKIIKDLEDLDIGNKK
jgi:hypothetical protein